MILSEKEFVKKANLRFWPKRVLALVEPAKGEFRQVCSRRVTAIIRLSVHSSETIWLGKISGFFLLHISPFSSVIEIAIFSYALPLFPVTLSRAGFSKEYTTKTFFSILKNAFGRFRFATKNICRCLRFSWTLMQARFFFKKFGKNWISPTACYTIYCFFSY